MLRLVLRHVLTAPALLDSSSQLSCFKFVCVHVTRNLNWIRLGGSTVSAELVQLLTESRNNLKKIRVPLPVTSTALLVISSSRVSGRDDFSYHTSLGHTSLIDEILDAFYFSGEICQ